VPYMGRLLTKVHLIEQALVAGNVDPSRADVTFDRRSTDFANLFSSVPERFSLRTRGYHPSNLEIYIAIYDEEQGNSGLSFMLSFSGLPYAFSTPYVGLQYWAHSDEWEPDYECVRRDDATIPQDDEFALFVGQFPEIFAVGKGEQLHRSALDEALVLKTITRMAKFFSKKEEQRNN
jgi:hypothetical protein